MMATFAKQSVHKISINYNRPNGRFFIGAFMDKIQLSDKAEKEMSEAIKVMAVSAFTEKSQNLIPLDYVAALVGCPYQHTANFIVKQPSFPKGVRLKEKSHPRWIAGEVIRWCRINAKRIK